MKTPKSKRTINEETIIRALSELDDDKVKFLKKIAVGLVALPISDIIQIIEENNKNV